MSGKASVRCIGMFVFTEMRLQTIWCAEYTVMDYMSMYIVSTKKRKLFQKRVNSKSVQYERVSI